MGEGIFDMRSVERFKPDLLKLAALLQILFTPIFILGNPDTSTASKRTAVEPFQSSAFWLSASLGGGTVFDTDRDDRYSGQTISFSTSAHLRYHHKVLSCGFQGGLLSETHSVTLGYITFGKSVYQSVWQEVIISAGISRNQLGWADDMSDAERIDAICLGFPLQLQYLFHLPVGVGGGIAMDLNLNHRAIMISFSFQAAVGVWIL
jgi:hypothetical protein